MIHIITLITNVIGFFGRDRRDLFPLRNRSE